MAFVVRSGERQFRVSPRILESDDHEDRYLVLMDDSELRLSVTRISPTNLSVLLGNRSYNVEVERSGQEYRVMIRGEVFYFRVYDEFVQSADEDSRQGEAVISAPMPGLVVKLLVSQGEEVTAGQGLLVLEAMKMQNEIPSPGSGTVGEISVNKGQTVMTGDTLLVIE
jgi:biotin carboxyl carrier protein